jgi:hypothetical protein
MTISPALSCESVTHAVLCLSNGFEWAIDDSAQLFFFQVRQSQSVVLGESISLVSGNSVFFHAFPEPLYQVRQTVAEVSSSACIITSRTGISIYVCALMTLIFITGEGSANHTRIGTLDKCFSRGKPSHFRSPPIKICCLCPRLNLLFFPDLPCLARQLLLQAVLSDD